MSIIPVNHLSQDQVNEIIQIAANLIPPPSWSLHKNTRLAAINAVLRAQGYDLMKEIPDSVFDEAKGFLTRALMREYPHGAWSCEFCDSYRPMRSAHEKDFLVCSSCGAEWDPIWIRDAREPEEPEHVRQKDAQYAAMREYERDYEEHQESMQKLLAEELASQRVTHNTGAESRSDRGHRDRGWKP